MEVFERIVVLVHGEKLAEGTPDELRRHPAVIEVEDISVRYGQLEAVRSVSFRVERGEPVALIGANGAGKSSTLKAIAGLVPCSHGRIRQDGDDVHTLSPEHRVRRGIALSPEGRRLFGRMTVLENLLVGAHTVASRAARDDTLQQVYGVEQNARLALRLAHQAHALEHGKVVKSGQGHQLLDDPFVRKAYLGA